MRVAIYLRVSRIDLHPENQKRELEQYAKAQKWDYDIFEEKESTRKTRPVKTEVLEKTRTRKYDLILVYKLDRWARSLQELINDFNLLQIHKAQFISLKDNIVLNDDPRNMLMIHILGAFAEFEREMIRERTIAGLARVKAQGKKLGRPRKNKTPPVNPSHFIEDSSVNKKRTFNITERRIKKNAETSNKTGGKG